MSGVNTGASDHQRIAMLDGWRAISILAVMAGHLFPLGPAFLQLNAAVATSGMAIFFTLSGFLITRQLLHDDRVGPFLIRRLFRILPLAWAAMTIIAIATGAGASTLAANLLFYANLPPAHLMHGGEVLWSLCVEAQFYMLAAALVALGGRRALYGLPLLGLVVTVFRIAAGQPISIITWHRVDEIMAGALLALLMARRAQWKLSAGLAGWATFAFAALLLAASSPHLPAFNYARPYFAAAMVGTSLLGAPPWMQRIWTGHTARYVANISYALYIVHGALSATWLGGEEASTAQRYLRRPLLLGAAFLIAHLSTFRYERHGIAMGKLLITRLYGTRLSRKPAEQSS